MIDKSSLKDQIKLILLWVLPFSMMMLTGPSGASFVFVNIFRLIIPIFVFCILFGRMKSGSGAEFKQIRIVIAGILWSIAWKYQVYNFNDYLLDVSSISHGIDRYGLIVVFYDAFTLSMVVILSYILGKWVHNFFEYSSKE